MIINLGHFNYDNKTEVVDKLKALASQIEGNTFLMYFGDLYGEPAYLEALEIYLKEFDEDLVIKWLLPFSTSLETFEVAFNTLIVEMMNFFDCRSVEELRNEAYERFGTAEWLRIDEIVTIYSAEINGETYFYELMEARQLKSV